MMTVHDIRAGTLVEIVANGEKHRMYIRGMTDARVSFARKSETKRGGWWLPVEHVKMWGTVIKRPEAAHANPR